MRSLTLCGALPLLAAPFGAWALSLGEIDIRSTLNQPLEAEIELSATAEELQSLNVTLASAETFARYGLDRPGFLATLEFRVGTNAAGRSVILVRSRQSIAEPFVEMLVEASSRSGRLLRQYTVFLDPPTLLPQAPLPAAIQPPQTRPPEAVAGGPVPRTPAPQPAVTPAPVTPAPAAPTPAVAPAQAVAPAPGTGAGGTYGPVRNAETLWGIAAQYRPNGVTMNQMMVAVFQANPQAFDGNMNVLHRGAILRIPELAELQSINAGTATAEVQRQTDTWRGRPAEQQPRLTLRPASDDAAPAGAARGTGTDAADAEVTTLRAEVSTLQAELEESRRLLELRNNELRVLQEQLSRDPTDPASPAEAPAVAADPGVGLEAEPLFADDPPVAVEEPGAEPEAEVPPPAAVTPPRPAQAVVTQPPEPSLVQQIVGWLATPIVWIVVGAGVVLLGLLAFLRRRRAVVADDVTGQWEALEAEVEVDEAEREATARIRRQALDEDFLVHEQRAGDDAPAERSPRAREPVPDPWSRDEEPESAEQTLSSQTVINLDQADPVAEADFHMAYGLYDQAADLVSKALQANPDSRELKLKLLEVFFVWGNKESFLNSAQSLRKEMGAHPDSDWDKVIIMGKQICPDEPLFADAKAAAGELDLDLVAGDAPALDLAFDDSSADEVDLDLGGGFGSGDVDFEIESTAERDAPRSGRDQKDDSMLLDIGERTQAGLEEALFQLDEAASATTPDLDLDSLAETHESPTVETEKSGFARDDDDEWSAVTTESPTVEASGPGGTATVKAASFGDEENFATVETPTIESTFGGFGERDEALESGGGTGEYTAELNLDDLGLDIADVEGLPNDLGELPSADDGESDTREQPVFGTDSDLLSATGVTQVLRDNDDDLEHLGTEIFGDDDKTTLAPGVDDVEDVGVTQTAILEPTFGDLGDLGDDDVELDLNLDDFSSALEGGGDTVEQPRAASFGRGVFGGGATPIDLDVGADVRGDDEPTGTEDVGPLDPQTMTEVGTKLDLARAYIDMGDPEGARSILEEVLDEGDSGQRREAQSLLDMLPA